MEAGRAGSHKEHRRTVSAKSRPTTCLLIERKIISCYKFCSGFCDVVACPESLIFSHLSLSLPSLSHTLCVCVFFFFGILNPQSSIPAVTVTSSTDESLTTKVDTLRRLFRKLMTYNIQKAPAAREGDGDGARQPVQEKAKQLI